MATGVAVAVGAWMLGGLHGCSDDPPAAGSPRPHIVLITLDTLRADHLGCDGYDPYGIPVTPTLDGLAAEGVRFEQCIAPRGQTLPSLSSMMSGRYPSAHGIRENGHSYANERQVTLAEVLGRMGYETAARVAIVPMLKPDTRESGPARGFDSVDSAQWSATEALETVNPSLNDWDRWVAEQAKAFFAERADQERPFFLWLHFYSIHRPYAPPGDYHRMFVGDYDGELMPEDDAPFTQRRRLDGVLSTRGRAGTPLSAEEHAYALSQYDGGVRFVDDLVGDLLVASSDLSNPDGTMTIVTADHGEELGDRQGYYFHGNSVYDGTLRIPLIVHWPDHVAPRVVGDVVSNVDLLPTVVSMLGEEPASIPDLEGVDLSRAIREGAAVDREAVFFEWQDLMYGSRSRTAKLIENPMGAQPRKPPFQVIEGVPDHEGFVVGRREVYDVRADPGERRNLAGSEASVPVESLAAWADEHWDRPARLREWGEMDADTLLQLKSLGYIGSLPGRADVYIRGDAE